MKLLLAAALLVAGAEPTNDDLLRQEAARRNMTPQQVLRVEVEEKVPPVTDEQAKAWYESVKGSLNGSFEDNRNTIKDYLRQRAYEAKKAEFAKKLRERAKRASKRAKKKVSQQP